MMLRAPRRWKWTCPERFQDLASRCALKHGAVMRRGATIRLGPKGPVVDNDGVHGMIEKRGTVYLTAGFQPIRVEWFNGVEGLGLEVAYDGPESPAKHSRLRALAICVRGDRVAVIA